MTWVAHTYIQEHEGQGARAAADAPNQTSIRLVTSKAVAQRFIIMQNGVEKREVHASLAVFEFPILFV